MSFLSSCTSGGCGAKIGAGELAAYLKDIPVKKDPNLLVGFDSADDAAVYQISAEQAIISTSDFFPPMIDDPYVFGQIAATNALSDVYAMGGTPLMALNLVCFPQKMDKEILAAVLAGGAEKILEAGAVLCGGHSIYDHEPKYGLAVTGQVHPKHFLRNNTCQLGDILILTKPLGVGLILSALRNGADTAEDHQAQQAAIQSMTRLNRYAAEKLSQYPVHACTDITGFGLLVHSSEMAGTDFTLQIDTASLPILPKVQEYARDGYVTGGGGRNRMHLQKQLLLDHISADLQEVLFDPQTSGGLLICVAEASAQALLDAIRRDDPDAAIIGNVIAREQYPLKLV